MSVAVHHPSRAAGRRVSVRAKILGLVGVFAAVAVALGVVATTQVRTITAEAAQMAQTQAGVATSLTALKDALWGVRNTITSIAAYPADQQQAQVDKLTAAYGALADAQTVFVDAYTASQGHEPEHWAQFTDALAAYRGIVDGELMDAALAGDAELWAQVRDSGAADLGGQMVGALTEVEAEVTAAMPPRPLPPPTRAAGPWWSRSARWPRRSRCPC